MPSESIRIKYLVDGLIPVEKIAQGDWVDLRSAEDVLIRNGEYKLIRLGIAMQLPEGYEAWVVPRSSTPKNFGIIMANSMGIIDESYNGDSDEWRFPAIGIRETMIHKNDRICQFRIVKHQPDIEFVSVDTLGNSDRGGIGSTGIR